MIHALITEFGDEQDCDFTLKQGLVCLKWLGQITPLLFHKMMFYLNKIQALKGHYQQGNQCSITSLIYHKTVCFIQGWSISMVGVNTQVGSKQTRIIHDQNIFKLTGKNQKQETLH